MSKEPVSCPHCENIFTTNKKEDIQCSSCKERFNIKESVLNFKKSQNEVRKRINDEQDKKLRELLERLSDKHTETGVDIKEIYKIAIKRQIKK